jgi:EAL domain-containing protein (putative c-di-GMP-specific phosphodiesterase class I)
MMVMENTKFKVFNPGASRKGCQVLPARVAGPGTLHLRFPSAHSLVKAQRLVQSFGWEFTHTCGTLSIHVPQTDMTSLVLSLHEALLPLERADVRVIFQAQGRNVSLDEFFEVDSLDTFLSRLQGAWLIDMMQQDRLMSVFQPIVHCTDSSRVFAYECLLRGVEGDSLVCPDRLIGAARGLGFLQHLDLWARNLALHGAASHGIRSKIFINFTPTALHNPLHCLRTTALTVDELGLDRSQIVFEITEGECIHDVAHLCETLDHYRDCGFGIALDDLGSGYASLNLLGCLRPDYVKLDQGLVRGVDHDGYKALIAQKLLETARELKIETVAEGVECETEFAWLQQHGADYVQGFHFALPASPPPMVQSGTKRNEIFTQWSAAVPCAA